MTVFSSLWSFWARIQKQASKQRSIGSTQWYPATHVVYREVKHMMSLINVLKEFRLMETYPYIEIVPFVKMLVHLGIT